MRSRSKPTGAGSSGGEVRRVSTRRERQIVRILALLRLLAQGKQVSVGELAAEFRTRRETIYRDLRVLQDAGYPITGDERGYLARPRLLSSRLPELPFTAAERQALQFAAAQVDAALPDRESLASASFKLKTLARAESDAARPGAEAMLETWACGEKDFGAHEAHVARLLEAILRQRRCLVEYRKPARLQPKSYEFDPYRLLIVGGGLYVVGRVPKHAGTATLAIDRLLSVVLSESIFEIDPDFDAQACRRDAFGVSWEDPIEVVLRFRADQAPYVRERQWHPSQELADLPDGGLRLAFRAGGPFEIRRWILGWGDAVEVLSPDTLRAEVRATLAAAAEQYGTTRREEC